MSIHSDAENELVKTLAEQSNSCVWIGLLFHVSLMELHWSDGSSVSFTNLIADAAGSSQPSNARRRRRQIDPNKYMCVTYDIVSGFWAQESCLNECSFVCNRKGWSN